METPKSKKSADKNHGQSGTAKGRKSASSGVKPFFAYNVTVRELGTGNPIHPADVHLEPRQSGLNPHDGSTGGANGIATITVDYNGYYDIEATAVGYQDGIDMRKNVYNGGSHTIYLET